MPKLRAKNSETFFTTKVRKVNNAIKQKTN